jgi:hypothetical protein
MKAFPMSTLDEDAGKRGALLHEAAALLDRVPAGVRSLHSVRLWQNWIGEAQRR